jgi:23S rRNA (cytosine1962-C5)-methyltransferase
MRKDGHDIRVNAAAADAARRGHPWVFRHAVSHAHANTRRDVGARTGDEVAITTDGGAFVGRGVYDADSPIAVRVWTTEDEPLGPLATARVEQAIRRRRALFPGSATTAYRVLNGEGDRLPGYVVDRYAEVGVLRIDGAAAEARLDALRPALELLEGAGIRSLVVRGESRGDDARSIKPLFGPAPPKTIEVREHDVPFVVDLARGQKTGAFLDQRENRRRVGAIVLGRPEGARRVLNLFSYAGGFSLRAALAGGTVTSVDIAAQAHATAQASFALAKADPRAHEFVTADAFAFLEDARKKKRAWDVVVCDPPSFAPSEKAKPRALAAYRALHKACAAVLAPGGVFCAASCSSHVDLTDFAATLDDTALGRSDLSLTDLFGPPSDHPSLAGWREGRYLKFAVLS